ncbi:MAG: Ku protein [Actinobacteria bacterium]|nr:MAG: Ku protein [Actinomycetota bacterium]
MARAIWSGTISFGLVNVPVKLYSAVHSKDLQFHQFDPKGNRIQYKRVSEKTGKEVDYSDIVKGYEVKKGQYVMVDPDELASYKPESTRTVDISDFVDLDQIDPVYYENTYYLAPDGKGAGKAYNLLLEAMEKQNKAAVGKVVIRTKQYLAAIRPLDGVLALSTMRFADEVVSTSEVKNGSSGKDGSVSKREVDMASQIIDSLTSEWDPSRYHDTYREQVLALLKKKAEGKEIVVEEPEEEQGQVLDLMAALEASLEEAKRGGSKKTSRAKKATTKKAGTKKTTAKKSSRSRAKKSA